MTVRVAASLWSVPTSELEPCARRLADQGVRRFHWDRADGLAAPEGGFQAEEARRLSELTNASAEAHLMVRDPRSELAEWAEFCDTIAVQADQPYCADSLVRIAELGVRAAVAVRTSDQLDQVPSALDVLVMAVDPGHAGSTFDERSHELVAAAQDAGHAMIGVDGSITPARLRRLHQTGARWFVSGTSLTQAESVTNWYHASGLEFDS